MRAVVVGILCALFLASVGVRAQQERPTPAPIVDAADEAWQVNGEPLLLDGLVFAAAGPDRFFDGNLMVRSGVYRGIPVYQDKTLEPWSVVYVPVAGHQMRPYERLRIGQLAGTAGSRTPSVPAPLTAQSEDEALLAAATSSTAVGTSGIAPPVAPLTATETSRREETRGPEKPPARAAGSTAREPNGIYIEFDDARWYGSGSPVSFSASLFVPMGTYLGIVVYRLKTDRENRIWVPVVPGGPLAPYSKR
jgi:hypothetical protein